MIVNFTTKSAWGSHSNFYTFNSTHFQRLPSQFKSGGGITHAVDQQLDLPKELVLKQWMIAIM